MNPRPSRQKPPQRGTRTRLGGPQMRRRRSGMHDSVTIPPQDPGEESSDEEVEWPLCDDVQDLEVPLCEDIHDHDRYP